MGARRSYVDAPSHGSAGAQEVRSRARCSEAARSVGLAPVGVVPAEVDSSAQLCPCPDRPVAGHAAWCLAARLVSMAFLEAAAVLAAVM